VTLVHRGNVGFSGISEIYVETAREMTEAVLGKLATDGGYDLLISAAAISDYTLDPSAGKIPSGSQLTLTLRPTEKLLEAVRDRHPDLVVVGFKLETDRGDAMIRHAKEVMDRYGLATIVANTVENMGGDEGEVWIISKNNEICHVRGTKDAVAGAIFDHVVT
jgi:phosphopantothenoylcysteine decarboxylase/phosphopantothenate--cysteine ligase